MSTPASDDRGAPLEGAPPRLDTTISVDDLWLGEWAADGIAQLERLLVAHAAFDRYLRARGRIDSDGDGAD